MNRFVFFALMANTWAQAQHIYLPDSAPGSRTDTQAQSWDGVFLLNSAAGVRAALEGREALVRFPVVRTTPPKVRGILLMDSLPNSQVAITPTGVVLSNITTASKSGFSINVILDEARPEELTRVVVLGSEVFWDVRINRSRAPHGSGWLVLPVESGSKAAQCLRDAARVFGAAEQYVLDLRLSERERNLPAKVAGQVTEKDIAEIRQLIFATARQSILEELAEYSHEAWSRSLRPWPGRQALEITSPDGRYAAVYYAPNAGYQMEKIDGKWTIVGG